MLLLYDKSAPRIVQNSLGVGVGGTVKELHHLVSKIIVKLQ